MQEGMAARIPLSAHLIGKLTQHCQQYSSPIMIPGTAEVEEPSSTEVILFQDISHVNPRGPDGIGLVVHLDDSGQQEECLNSGAQLGLRN